MQKQDKHIWIEDFVPDPKYKGMFDITYTLVEDGVTKKYKKKHCAYMCSADMWDNIKDGTFIFLGFESVNLPENTEELPICLK